MARARELILSGGMGDLPGLAAAAVDFLSLKLGRVDLAEVARSLPPEADAQTVELVAKLQEPFRCLVDFSDERSVARFRSLCEAEGVTVAVASPDRRRAPASEPDR